MPNHISKISIYLVIAVVIAFGVYYVFGRQNSNMPEVSTNTNIGTSANTSTSTPQVAVASTSTEQQKKEIAEPIADAIARITKKSFGLKVSPGHSPVSPEKFNGYHTGVDFETLLSEQNVAVPIYAICPGKFLMKKIASDYGGVAVQSCKIAGENVTVIYGHLKLSSIGAKIKQELKAGEQIGILGQGYSAETSGERKHLHLGIHKGTAINILGYVQSAGALKDWLDAASYL